jgi:choline dehydrogenase
VLTFGTILSSIPSTIYSSRFSHALTIFSSYLSDEAQSDLNILIKSTRLLLRIARSSPFVGKLDLPKDTTEKSSFWWPGDANPDTVRLPLVK